MMKSLLVLLPLEEAGENVAFPGPNLFLLIRGTDRDEGFARR